MFKACSKIPALLRKLFQVYIIINWAASNGAPDSFKEDAVVSFSALGYLVSKFDNLVKLSLYFNDDLIYLKLNDSVCEAVFSQFCKISMHTLLEKIVLLQVEHLTIITPIIEVTNIDILKLHKWLVHVLTVVVPKLDFHLWSD